MGEVKRLRQLSRSFVSPAEQLGEQIDGSSCCLACGGSSGIRGGSGGGAVMVEVCAQPIALTESASSIAARGINADLAITVFSVC